DILRVLGLALGVVTLPSRSHRVRWWYDRGAICEMDSKKGAPVRFNLRQPIEVQHQACPMQQRVAVTKKIADQSKLGDENQGPKLADVWHKRLKRARSRTRMQ